VLSDYGNLTLFGSQVWQVLYKSFSSYDELVARQWMKKLLSEKSTT